MGFVLAGGRSSRMGRNKALLPHRGGVLVEFVAATVQAAAGTAALVGSPERYARLGYPVIPDLYPGEGPLGGILTALAYSTATWNLIVACDMPALTEAFLDDLFRRAEAADADILLPLGKDGRIEPLCAVYQIRTHPALARAFASGIRKIAAALEGLRTVPVTVPDLAVLHNINTPTDWINYAGHGSISALY
jgi:molybdopterin-guanine dinucleotide biosynthesis protein A